MLSLGAQLPRSRTKAVYGIPQQTLYPLIGGHSKRSTLTWVFNPGTKIKFSHLEYEDNVTDWQGTQIPFIGFDKLTHFTKHQFLYLIGRNRSTSGVWPYIRATCNPDPDCWVAEFLEWWIDQEIGYPIPERSGVLRYFVNDSGNFVWGDTKEEVIEKCPHIFNRIDRVSGQSIAYTSRPGRTDVLHFGKVILPRSSLLRFLEQECL